MKNDLKFFVGLARDVAMLTFLILRITEVALRLVRSAGIYWVRNWLKSIDIEAASNLDMAQANTFTFKPSDTKPMAKYLSRRSPIDGRRRHISFI
jgi:hypothetical protein